MFHLKVGVSNALWSLQSYLYSAEEKILPAEQAWPTAHRQCPIHHVTDLCTIHHVTDLCHTRGAGPDPAQWLTQGPTLSRELPAKLEEFLWCRGCSCLTIKTRLGQSLWHIPDEPWCSQHLGLSLLPVPGCPLLQHPTNTAACLPFPWGQLWSHCIIRLRQTGARSPAEGKNGLVPFTAAEQNCEQQPGACPRGKTRPYRNMEQTHHLCSSTWFRRHCCFIIQVMYQGLAQKHNVETVPSTRVKKKKKYWYKPLLCPNIPSYASNT